MYSLTCGVKLTGKITHTLGKPRDFRIMLAGLLPGSLCVSGSSCDPPSGHIFYAVFSCFQTSIEMGLKNIQVAAALLVLQPSRCRPEFIVIKPLALKMPIYIYIYIYIYIHTHIHTHTHTHTQGVTGRTDQTSGGYSLC